MLLPNYILNSFKYFFNASTQEAFWSIFFYTEFSVNHIGSPNALASTSSSTHESYAQIEIDPTGF